MAHLINKDAVVAEIERLKTIYNDDENIHHVSKYNILVDILSLLDTLEVKEVQEEHVSERLEEAVNAYIGYAPDVDESSWTFGRRQAFKAGAKWQKEQDKETIELAEDHAMLAGMNKMEQQMMSKAIVREVKVDAGGYPYIDATELYDYDEDKPLAKAGDKVKILVINED